MFRPFFWSMCSFSLVQGFKDWRPKFRRKWNKCVHVCIHTLNGLYFFLCLFFPPSEGVGRSASRIRGKWDWVVSDRGWAVVAHWRGTFCPPFCPPQSLIPPLSSSPPLPSLLSSSLSLSLSRSLSVFAANRKCCR